MKASEIRKMTTDEIHTKIKELKAELFDMRMKMATGNLEKTHEIDKKRKTVARLKTVLNEKDGSDN
ncbi:MAG: 50S ribosomal protein L29 [Bacilli bacterium]|nr:50S ribosomal protein L29 [Bacilli bacterium]